MFKLSMGMCLFVCTSFAADMPGSKPLALPDFSQVSKQEEDGGFNVGFHCEDDNGRKLKKDDVGFQSCMEKSQRSARDRFKQ